MSVTVQTQENTNFVEVTLRDRITRQDYEMFQPIIDAAIKKHGRICMLVVARNFDGWDLGTSWEETRFVFSRYSKIDRIGLVGAAEWQKWLTFLSQPFTSAEVKYFSVTQEAQARNWVSDAAVIYVAPKPTQTSSDEKSVAGKDAEHTVARNEMDLHNAGGHVNRESPTNQGANADSSKGDPDAFEERISEKEVLYSDMDDEPLLEDDEELTYQERTNHRRERELVGAE